MATTRKSAARPAAAKSPTGARGSAAASKAGATQAVKDAAAQDIAAQKAVVETAAGASAPAVKRSAARSVLSSLDPNEIVELQSRCDGRLVYKSRAGYLVEWAEYGSVHLVPVSELIKMRNEQPAFFRNHWVYPVSENASDVIVALQLDRYYNSLTDLEDFDDIFSYEPDQLEHILQGASPAMRENVARRAAALITEGAIDSFTSIEIIEKLTGFSLRE